MDRSYINENSFINASGLGIETYYLGYIWDNTIFPPYFPVLQAMATGLSDSYQKAKQFEDMVKRGWIAKLQLNVTKDLLKRDKNAVKLIKQRPSHLVYSPKYVVAQLWTDIFMKWLTSTLLRFDFSAIVDVPQVTEEGTRKWLEFESRGGIHGKDEGCHQHH